MKNKKGMAEMVAVVLQIVITLAAVGIIIAAVMPIIKDKITESTECKNSELRISTEGGFTCYKEESNEAYVGIERGMEKSALSDIALQLEANGTTKSTNIKKSAMAEYAKEKKEIAKKANPKAHFSFDEEGEEVKDIVHGKIAQLRPKRQYTYEDALTKGQVGNAIQFDGEDDDFYDQGHSSEEGYVSWYYEDLYYTNDNTFSFEMWINPYEFGPGKRNIVLILEGYYSAEGNFFNALSIINGSLELSIIDNYWSKINASFQTQNVLKIDEFSHVALTYNASTLKIYVNGENVGAWDYKFLIDHLEPKIGGGSYYGYGNAFSGVIDELRIYNTTLTIDEINTSYQRGLQGLASNINYGLIAYLPFDSISKRKTCTGEKEPSLLGTEEKITGHYFLARNYQYKIGMPKFVEAKQGKALKSENVGYGWVFNYAVVPAPQNLIKIKEGENMTIELFIQAPVREERIIYIESVGIEREWYTFRFGVSSSYGWLNFIYDDSCWGDHGWNTHKYLIEFPPIIEDFFHVAITYTFGNGSSMKMYVNGKHIEGLWNEGDGNCMSPEEINDLPLFIGDGASTIDEFAIYNRTLTEEEIAEHAKNMLEKTSKIELPALGAKKVYKVNASDMNLTKVESVSVAPIVKVGKKEINCGVINTVEIKKCS